MKKVIMFFLILFSSFIYCEEENISDIQYNSVKKNNENMQSKEINDAEIEKMSEVNKFIRIKGNFDLPGQIEGKSYSTNITKKLADLESGISGMVEGVYRINDKNEIALGLGIQGIGYLDTYYGVQANNYAIPFYVSAKHNLFKLPLYVKALFGVTYNIGTDDLKYFITAQEDPTWGLAESDVEIDHGFYGGLGMGVDIGKIEVEALYSINTINATFQYSGSEYSRELRNHRISLGLSYAFDWNK